MNNKEEKLEMNKEKPRFVISRQEINDKLKSLYSICDEVSYSWKTNPYVGVVLNEKESCYVSVHSIAELEQVPRKGKVWFFGFAWDNSDLDVLIGNYKIRNFVVDNEDDLNVLLGYVTQKNWKINLLLRMKMKENTLLTGKHYVFGMKSVEVKKLIPLLRENQFIDQLGVHFHRKTQNVSEWSLKEEMEETFSKSLLGMINIINFGGGLPGKYKNTNDKAIEIIFGKLKEFKNYLSQYNIKLIAEPGRYIASSSVKLETKITAIHGDTIFVNFSIFQGALDTVVANVKLLVENELEGGNKYTIKGSTPDSCDILRYTVYLENPKVGDKLVFLNCGAYTYSTDFCALPKPEVVVVDRF